MIKVKDVCKIFYVPEPVEALMDATGALMPFMATTSGNGPLRMWLPK